ncbi:MAG TPA: RNA polymerase sigma factor SigM [Actinomycetes bacterium]|nr:RNA polymerase sigma factor SigM [Actinomycetes bacterium]
MTDDQRPDVDLLSAHVAGDPTAFTTLVRRHRDRLWAVALRTTGDPDEAADALQDALLSAHRSAGTFRGDAQVTTWLHRIVVNACLDRLRRAKARPTVPLPEHDSAHPIEPSDPLGRRELAWEIDRALQSLPDEQRAALVLVDVEGYSVDETAELLGIPSGTVKSRCARGRAKLVPLLEHLRNRAADDSVPVQGRQPVDPSTGTATATPADPHHHGAQS